MNHCGPTVNPYGPSQRHIGLPTLRNPKPTSVDSGNLQGGGVDRLSPLSPLFRSVLAITILLQLAFTCMIMNL